MVAVSFCSESDKPSQFLNSVLEVGGAAVGGLKGRGRTGEDLLMGRMRGNWAI